MGERNKLKQTNPVQKPGVTSFWPPQAALQGWMWKPGFHGLGSAWPTGKNKIRNHALWVFFLWLSMSRDGFGWCQKIKTSFKTAMHVSQCNGAMARKPRPRAVWDGKKRKMERRWDGGEKERRWDGKKKRKMERRKVLKSKNPTSAELELTVGAAGRASWCSASVNVD